MNSEIQYSSSVNYAKIVKLDLPATGFLLDSGKIITDVDVAYETYGTLCPAKDNVIFICHALTGDSHAASNDPQIESPGWWDAMIGPGKGIDTNHYYVICANIFGGCMGTTGPQSINPETSNPYGSSFPLITVGDIVNVHYLLIKQLGIEKLAAIVGGSFGGMQALEFTIRYPDMINRCVCIASSASLSTQALAFDIVGRNAITKDLHWQGGDYYSQNDNPESGLGLARKIGHITYLSKDMMKKKFGRERKSGDTKDNNSLSKCLRFCSNFQVESYLDYQANKFVGRFDANSYLHITRAMDEYDLKEKYGSLSSAFKNIQAKMLIVALNKDWLFPPEQSVEIANALLVDGKQVSYCNLDAPHGHDAFLVDIKNLSEVIRAFLPWIEETDKKKACKCDFIEVKGLKKKEYDLISGLIDKKKRVLDLGCGNGNLLSKLSNEQNISGLGLDIDIEQVIDVINAGHDIFQGDIDNGISAIPDNSFDYAILSETLQVVKKPKLVLNEMLRVAKEGLVSFPNLGKLSHRLRLGVWGQMPKDETLPFEWYNTPNIHLFTLKDFISLCQQEGISIVDIFPIVSDSLGKALVNLGFKNLGTSHILVRITKN